MLSKFAEQESVLHAQNTKFLDIEEFCRRSELLTTICPQVDAINITNYPANSGFLVL